MGSCTAGGAYIPALSDETVMVRGQAAVFIGGPPLVKAATGEEVSSEELGGADVHFNVTGLADYLADDDADAIRICREIVKSFKAPGKSMAMNPLAAGPAFDPTEIYGLLPPENKKPIDVKEIIARIVDGSRFQELKAGFGMSLTTGFAHVFGMPVGILANNSFLTRESSQKGAEFIALCNQRSVPLLFLQNITGFIVGKKYEHQGLIREGAKLIQAVANAVVPKITVVVGGSFGAGNYAMAGRAFDPDFLFMWPNSRISVMGGQQAKMVLETVGSRQADELSGRFETESSAYYSTSRLWDDGIIDPAKTRDVLGLTLSVVQNKAKI
jgi:3-methylcrotonyl-CoA carboxylase beta subunit